QTPLRLAIIGTTYHYGSELQILADRFLVGYPQQGDWHMPNVRVVSMYVEKAPLTGRGQRGQRGSATPDPVTHPAGSSDLSVARAKEFGFRLCRHIPEALRAGGDQLAVDAVLAVVEQGDYPRNRIGQILYPRYEFFQQCVDVFEVEGRAVPY